VVSLAHSILQLSIRNLIPGVTSNHYSAMAPKSRAIPTEEWERHKDVIRDLFAQKNLVEVIEEMKQKYDFDAT
jgi:hypothetical protein